MQSRRIVVVLGTASVMSAICASAMSCSAILGDAPAGKLLDGGAEDVTTGDGPPVETGADGGLDGTSGDSATPMGDSSSTKDTGTGGDSQVDAGDPVVQVASGGDATCAVTASGALYCWGQNTYGSVGDGTTTRRTTPVHITTDSTGGALGPVASVSAGLYFTCAALKNNTIYCWGNDDAGQLGDGVFLPTADAGVSDQHRPQKIPSLNASAVYAGFANACVPGPSSYTCWGSNGYGELGHTPGQMGDVAVNTFFYNYANSSPQVGPTVPTSTMASLGLLYGCANNTGTQGIECWGANSQGQLGQGQPEAGVLYSPNPTPVFVEVDPNGKLADWQEVAASAFSHACALNGQGELSCWGSSGSGQLGPSVTVQSGSFAFATSIMTGISHVAVGLFTTCAVDATQKVLCWGGNAQGLLGHDPSTDPIQSCPDNSEPCNPNPGTINVGGAPLKPVSKISVGFQSACALKTDGTVWCWGTLGPGAAGTNDAGVAFEPTQVTGLP